MRQIFRFLTITILCGAFWIFPAAATPADIAGDGLAAESEEADIPDTPVSYDLPAYEDGAVKVIGEVQRHIVAPEDTLMDIARAYGLGYVELRAANPGIDAWAPVPGTALQLPGRRLLPRAAQEGIVVNLGEMRLYYFTEDGAIETYPIGIGREGLQTPLGKTEIVRKLVRPSWYPTPRMREENPGLPERVRPGASNPLGEYALYLGWPAFLIHGTNRPWGIGRRVSSGCIRMYPEDVKTLYPAVEIGTRVTVVDQPVKLAWLEDGLYLEANPTRRQSDEIETEGEIPRRMLDSSLPKELEALILKEAKAGGLKKKDIDWTTARATFRARSGMPVKIADAKEPEPELSDETEDTAEAEKTEESDT